MYIIYYLIVNFSLKCFKNLEKNIYFSAVVFICVTLFFFIHTYSLYQAHAFINFG